MCILVVDPLKRGFESRDQRIFHIADRNHKGIVILVNKWDLIRNLLTHQKKFIEEIKEKRSRHLQMFLFYLFQQEKKQRLLKGLQEAINVFNNRVQKITTSKLNNYILPLIEKNPPPAIKGKYIKIKYCTQL